MRNALLLALFLTACATGSKNAGPFDPAKTPWSQPPLARAKVPAIYITEWEKAENRATCALIAPRSLGDEGITGQPRRAEFSGGWAVAYDIPGTRSAFGIAGTGSLASAPAYDRWPYKHTWTDGSKVGYGPEAGLGPNQLAYLTIAGQDCSYNVWSRLGVHHLEELIRELRMVQSADVR